MHELSIAVELVGAIERVVAGREIERIEEVSLAIGVMRQVAPEFLETAFAAAAAGTVAEGARLRMDFIQPTARCRPCGCRFEPKVDSFVCPQCGQADAEIVKGDEILLTSLTCEEKDGDPEREDQPGPERS